MATTKATNVTAGDFVAATRKYSNKDEEGRKFDISADVNISNGKVTSFSNGMLVKREDPSYGTGNFSRGDGDTWMSFNLSNFNISESKEAFNAVLDFVEAVNEDVKSQSVE